MGRKPEVVDYGQWGKDPEGQDPHRYTDETSRRIRLLEDAPLALSGHRVKADHAKRRRPA